MTNELRRGGSDREDVAREFRNEVDARIQDLLRHGASLEEIASLLGAEQFLKTTGSKQGAALDFNVRGFVDYLIGQGQHLRLPERLTKISSMILPAAAGGEIVPGSGAGMEKKKIVPRSRFLIELLSELNQKYSVIEGVNDPKSMRGLSYKIFIIPGLNKMVFVNDEEGNATFIIHELPPDQAGWQEFASMNKTELYALPDNLATSVIYPGSPEDWKAKLLVLLASNFEVQEQEIFKTTAINIAEAGPIPEGWMTTTALADSLGVAFATIARMAGKYLEANPDWFRAKNRLGKKAVYYHPDLVSIISKDIKGRKDAPEGWVTNHSLSIEFKISPQVITSLSEKYRGNHGEWFNIYLDKARKLAEHFSPELAVIIRKNFVEYKDMLTQGWLNSTGLAVMLDVGFATVKNRAERYHNTRKDWFKEYHPPGGKKLTQFYHPDLVAIISKDIRAIKEIGKVPQGWETCRSLASQFSIDTSTVLRFVESRHTGHPDWFCNYRLKDIDVVVEHYHPDLVELMKQHFSKLEKAPIGWKTVTSLVGDFKVSEKTIDKLAEPYRKDYERWFKNYVSGNGSVAEHLHPELVEIISNKLQNREKAPSGWLTQGALVSKLTIAYSSIKRIAERYRDDHESWFHEYLNSSGHPIEHYHPDLVDIIEADITGRKKPPEGWKNVHEMKPLLQRSIPTIKKVARKICESRPELTGSFADPIGKLATYYHPDIAPILVEELNKLNKRIKL